MPRDHLAAPRGLLAALALVAALWAVALPTSAAAQDPATDQPTLTVRGTGTVRVRPDQAVVFVAVRERGAQPGAVRDRANRRLAKIIAALTALGVAARDLQTSQIAFVRQHVGPKRARRTVYLAVAQLWIRTRHVGLLSTIFAAATREGAASFSGPNFSLSDPSAGVLAAERVALRNARRRADNAARTLGQRVVGVRSVNLDPDSTAETPASGNAPQDTTGTGRRRVPTPVRPGRVRVVAAAVVVFLLSS